MTNWQEVKLGELISIKHGYAFKGDDITTDDNGIVLVTPGNFAIGGGFQEGKCKFFKGTYPDDYVLKENNLIVTMTDLSKECDTLGYSALVPGGSRIYLHNQRIGLVEFKNQLINKNYLYWFMRTKKYQHFVVASCSGSVIKHTSPGRICNAIIPLPPLDVQKKIARVLGVLDDKIELNNKINNNLEQQAQALFLDIIRANDFDNKLLSEIALIKYGKGLPTNKLTKTGYKVFGGNGIIGYYTDYLYKEPQILISCRGAASGTILVSHPYSYVTNNSLVVELKDRRYFEFLKQYFALNQLHSYATGSAQPQVTIDNLKTVEVPYPDYKIISNASECFASISNKLYKNICENEKLAQLRDTLLPKLMSGEIDVSNVNISGLSSNDKLSFSEKEIKNDIKQFT